MEKELIKALEEMVEGFDNYTTFMEFKMNKLAKIKELIKKSKEKEEL